MDRARVGKIPLAQLLSARQSSRQTEGKEIEREELYYSLAKLGIVWRSLFYSGAICHDQNYVTAFDGCGGRRRGYFERARQAQNDEDRRRAPGPRTLQLGALGQGRPVRGTQSDHAGKAGSSSATGEKRNLRFTRPRCGKGRRPR